MPDRPATLQSVADRAGVSVATASRALSGRGDLARATRERVIAAAGELGYEKSAASTGRRAALDPRLIEMVLGSFDDAWTEAITSGAREAAFRLGFDLVLTLERSDPDDDWPMRVATRRPSGVILGIINPTSAQLNQMGGLRIPVVLLDPRSDPGGALASVGTTDEQGGYEAGRLLAAGGFERFVVVTGEPRYRFGRARENGFRRAVAEAHPDAEVVRVHSDWTDARVTESLLHALTSSRTPVGVFACNDEMAFAVYRAAKQAGRRIPEDVGVVGFNDEPRAARAQPPLTSVRQPLREMAGRAVALAAHLRGHESPSYERVELPSELIIRASTRPVPPPAPGADSPPDRPS